jgi:cytosine/adenosine deaminase-related metal-dependent hydrolase
MLEQTGTTTVADIEAAPELLPDVWDSTSLRVVSFLELTGVRSKRDPKEILGEAVDKIDSLTHPRCAASLSPHAPYSTSPELLRLCAQTGREKNLRLAVHVAESEQEFEMFAHARGEMFDWLKRNGRDNSDCGLGSPFQHVERAGLSGENFIAIHANYLDEADFGLIAGKKLSVVHCPRSHEYFNHQPFPLERLLAAHVNVCLGTDSLATVTKHDKEELELNLFQDMQLFARKNPAVQPQTILKMVTINGALALGMKGKIGDLTVGAFADLIAIPFTGKTSDAAEAVVHFPGHVRASMIGGRWIVGDEK